MPGKHKKHHCDICGENDGTIHSVVLMMDRRKRARFDACRSCRHAILWQFQNPLRKR